MVTKQVYVWRAGRGVVPIEEAGPREGFAPNRGVITDDMAPLEHPVDGRIYTSKSAFRNATRACGCYEAGTDNLTKNGQVRPNTESFPKERIFKELWDRMS